MNSHTYSKIVAVRGGGGGGSHLSTHTGNTRINACKDLKKTGKELISIYGNSSSGISNSISSMRFCFSFSVSGLCLAALPCNKIYLKHSDKILICFYGTKYIKRPNSSIKYPLFLSKLFVLILKLLSFFRNSYA